MVKTDKLYNNVDIIFFLTSFLLEYAFSDIMGKGGDNEMIKKRDYGSEAV